MKLLIEKKSGKPFPPPFDFDDNGKTAVAVGVVQNSLDPKHRAAFMLTNGNVVNCDVCTIIKELDTESSLITKEPLADFRLVSSQVGTVGYSFSDETIEMFRGCMLAYLNSPENYRGEWRDFVQSYM